MAEALEVRLRFASFVFNGVRGLAVQSGADVLGLTEDAPGYPGALEQLVRAGGEVLSRAHKELLLGRKLDPSQIAYLPPISNPGKIICVGLNYRDHTAESKYEQPDYPTFFARFSSSLIGSGSPIVRPAASETLDYEGEMVAVVGTGGRHIEKADALNHIVGYSIFNDASIREYQHRTPQWTVGKNFDETGAFGPWLVTADELPQGGETLKIETRLNGVVVQASNTSNLIFDVSTLVSTISEAITLSPCDIIVTGTPAGVGQARVPKLYMRHGDICEVEIESIGVLRNRIEDESIAVAKAS
jgi:acylpyruvate hydrolase